MNYNPVYSQKYSIHACYPANKSHVSHYSYSKIMSSVSKPMLSPALILAIPKMG